MVKKINIRRVFALLAANFILMSSFGCSKEQDKQLDNNDNNSYSMTDEACELIKTKEKISNELISINNNYDIGLIDYINNYINFGDDYIPYDYQLDECNYFNKIDEYQRRIIYDFAYDYTQYTKYLKNNDIENIRKYIVRMVNDKREFGNMRCVLLKTLPKELSVLENDKYLFEINNIKPLVVSEDYQDYISFLYRYNKVVSKQTGKISIYSMNYDAIDEEIAEFILFIHLYIKYNEDPLHIIKTDNGYFLANKSDFIKYLEDNKDSFENYSNDLFKNFILEKIVDKWVLKYEQNIYKEITSKSLINYLDNLSNKYQKSIFNYEEMNKHSILKNVFYDIPIEEVNKDEEINLENYWWPIGSSEIETIDGIKYASGYPEETYISKKLGYIGGKHGINIIASKSGEVIYPKCEEQTMYEKGNEEGGEYGNYVIIKHDDGNYTLYAHLSENSITVMAGDHVYQGQVIGKMGRSGNAYDTYLEFEIRQNYNNAESKVNIFDYIREDNPRNVSSEYTLIYENNSWVLKSDNIIILVINDDEVIDTINEIAFINNKSYFSYEELQEYNMLDIILKKDTEKIKIRH